MLILPEFFTIFSITI